MPRTAIEVGALRADLNLQSPSGLTADGYATVVAGVPAHVRSAGGNELLRFGAQVAVNPTVITMRYRRDLKSDWRLTWPAENRVFQITSFGDEDGDRKWLTVYATELLGVSVIEDVITPPSGWMQPGWSQA